VTIASVCNAEAVRAQRTATAPRGATQGGERAHVSRVATSPHPRAPAAGARNGSASSACEPSKPPRSIASLIAKEMADISRQQSATRERRKRACAVATQVGTEEPGDELPISTRRAFPTGKPRHVAQLALSRLRPGFPGECGSSVFPLPTGEGAEGEGSTSLARTARASLRQGRADGAGDGSSPKNNAGIGANRCQRLSASDSDAVADRQEPTPWSQARNVCARERSAFGPPKGPKHEPVRHPRRSL